MVSVETASGVQHTFSHPDMHTHYCIDTGEVRHSDNCQLSLSLDLTLLDLIRESELQRQH